MNLKLNIEIIAKDHEGIRNALEQIKKDTEIGAVFFSTKNYNGFNYKGKISKIYEEDTNNNLDEEDTEYEAKQYKPYNQNKEKIKKWQEFLKRFKLN
jgi:hypothetical protein